MHIIQYRLVIVVLICGFLLLINGCGKNPVTFVSDDMDSTEEAAGADDNTATGVGIQEASGGILADEQADSSTEQIPVYVCGAVNNPGVYYLPVGSLKQDALLMAGGFTEDACLEYVNLAETISEGEQIYFPTLSEIESMSPIYTMTGDSAEDDRVHINVATKEQLMTLPGIGESKADAIISYRNEHGPFASPEDLLNVSGIKDGVYQRIKDYIVVD